MALRKFLANLVFLVHIAWSVLILWGTFFIIRHRWYIPWHLGVLTLTAGWGIIFQYCPLTVWEEKLRKKYNPDINFNGSFFALYLNKFFHIRIDRHQVTRFLTTVHLLNISFAIFLLFI